MKNKKREKLAGGRRGRGVRTERPRILLQRAALQKRQAGQTTSSAVAAGEPVWTMLIVALGVGG